MDFLSNANEPYRDILSCILSRTEKLRLSGKTRSQKEQTDVTRGNCHAHVPHQLSDGPSVDIQSIFTVYTFLLYSAERRESQKDVAFCSEFCENIVPCIKQMALRHLKKYSLRLSKSTIVRIGAALGLTIGGGSKQQTEGITTFLTRQEGS